MTAADWGFSDADDAVRYLGEIRRLWAVWVTGVFVLMSTPGSSMVFISLGVAVLLLILVRPIQRRATQVVPFNTASTTRWSHRWGRATARDQVLRHLLVGEAPLAEAVRISGRSDVWLLARKVVIAATTVAFALIVLGAATGWDISLGGL